MKALHVYVNGKPHCLAGIGDDGGLTVFIEYSGKAGQDRVDLCVSGLIVPVREYVHWMDRDLRVGDEVLVRVVEAESVDEPTRRHRPDPAQQRKAEIAHLRRTAKKLGLEVRNQRKKPRRK